MGVAGRIGARFLMTAEITPFTFPDTGQPVRTVTRDGEPWFVVADACKVLELTNPSVVAGRLDVDDLSITEVIDSIGRKQRAHVVSEGGLYELVFLSRKPQARAFKRWITHEVIPAVRRTGRYEVAPAFEIPASFADALELAARQARELETATARVAELEPAARAWDTLADATGDYSLRDAAHILNRDPAITTGQNRLMTALRDLGMVDRRGIPYAKHNTHLVERAVAYDHPHTHEPQLKTQVRITARGLRYLRDRLVAPVAPGHDDGLFDTA